MQFLILLFKITLVIYILVWAILLILCIRKKEFWPILGDSRSTKYFWLATFIFFNPVLTILYFIFGQIRSPKAKYNRLALPTALAFIILGFRFNFPGLGHLWMQPFQGRDKNASGFQTSLAAIKSNNNTNYSSTHYTNNNSRLACRSVAVICEQDDILLNRVGNYLEEMIKEIHNVEDVNFYKSDSPVPESAISPDIFIRLKINNFKENYLPYILNLQVGISASVSNHAMSGAVGHYYDRTPPIINYSIGLNLTHESETIGYESRRYDSAARDIAKQISKELEKNLKTWQKKYGLLPDIPEDFYGKYKNNVLPEPFYSFELTKLYSYSGFIKHNETFWRMDVAEDVVEQLTQLMEQMEELGWKKLSSEFSERFLDLRLEKENRLLHIFKPEKEKKETPAYLYICDEESLSDEELYPAIDKLFEEPVNMELVKLFDRMFNSQQRDKYFELLRSKPLNSMDLQIRLAEMYEGKGMREEAKQTFLHAKALFWVIPETNEFRNRLNSLAKKFGDEKLVQQAPEKDVLLEMGAIEVTEDTQPFVIEAAPDENVIVFSQYEDGTLDTICLSCTPLDESNQSFILNSATNSKNNGKSWGTSNSNQQNNGSSVANHSNYDPRNSFSIHCNVTKEKTNDKYLMSFEPINISNNK